AIRNGGKRDGRKKAQRRARLHRRKRRQNRLNGSGVGAAGALPPAAGEEGAGRVGEEIAGVAGGAGENERRNDLGGDRPDGEMKPDFSPAGRRVVAAEVEAALNPERERKRGGDQKQVVEVGMEKSGVRV